MPAAPSTPARPGPARGFAAPPAAPDTGPGGGLAGLVSSAAHDSPGKLALVEASGRNLTFSQLEDEVGRVATGLGEAGVVAGYRVMLAVGNRLEFVTCYLGTLRAQAVAVPVDPASSIDELARMLADSGARVIVTDASAAEAVRAAVAALEESAARPRIIAVGTEPEAGERGYEQLRAADPGPLPEFRDPERLAVLLYTSGTSGPPRAAMLSHRALLANLAQMSRVEPPLAHGDDVVLGVLPLFHVYGLNAVLGSVLHHRAKLVIVERFEPHATLDVVDDEACSVLPLAPAVFAAWREVDHLAERLGPVRLVLSCYPALPLGDAAEFGSRTGIAVHQGYGLTEAAPVVTSTLCSARGRSGVLPAPTSLGSALPGVEVRLLDAQGRPVEGEDAGEVAIRGANLFSGYWPDGAGGPDVDGWWATGDVGMLDDHGDLVLVDRVQELVLVSGFNVYPAEVEAVVGEVGGVAQVAVVAAPDERTGEAVVAYVVAAAAAAADAGADAVSLAAAVREHCATRLARFKQPARVEVVQRLPLTATGTVQKGRLRRAERLRAGGLAP